MKLSEELYSAFISRDLVEIDFYEKAKKLEEEIDCVREELDSLKQLYKELTWSNQR